MSIVHSERLRYPWGVLPRRTALSGSFLWIRIVNDSNTHHTFDTMLGLPDFSYSAHDNVVK